MSVLQLVYVYLLTVPVFFLIDILWIGLIANKFYQSQIGHLLGSTNWTAAIGFYLIYIVGIIIFAINPALTNGSIGTAALYGALFGFFAYATYDFTNLATIESWPLLMSLVDTLWGTILTGSVAAISYYLARLFVL